MPSQCDHLICQDCECMCHQAAKEGVGTWDFVVPSKQMEVIGVGLRTYMGADNWLAKRNSQFPSYPGRLPFEVQKRIRGLAVSGEPEKAVLALGKHLLSETSSVRIRNILKEAFNIECLGDIQSSGCGKSLE